MSVTRIKSDLPDARSYTAGDPIENAEPSGGVRVPISETPADAMSFLWSALQAAIRADGECESGCDNNKSGHQFMYGSG